MEFSVLKSDILKYLNMIAPLAQSYKGNKTILKNVLMDLDEDRLRLVSANDESEMMVDIPSSLLQVTEYGKAAVPAASLNSICKSDSGRKVAPDDDRIYFAVDTIVGKLTATHGSNQYEINTFDANLYPNMTKVDSRVAFDITQGELSDILSATAFAMASDDVRHFLNGLNVTLKSKRLHCVASDSHRLSFYSMDLLNEEDDEKTASVIIAKNGINALRKLIAADDSSITVTLGQTYAKFTTGSFTFVTKLIDDKCIDGDHVFPNEKQIKAKIKIDRESWIAAVKSAQVLLTAEDKGKMIVDIKDQMMILKTRNASQEASSCTLPLPECDCQDLHFAINGLYLTSVLECLSCKDVLFCLTDKSSVIEPIENNNYCSEKFIIMLVQL